MLTRTERPNLPCNIALKAEFFGDFDAPETVLVGTVHAVIRDSEGTLWCAFELADMQGLFLISCGSNFFEGFFVDA